MNSRMIRKDGFKKRVILILNFLCFLGVFLNGKAQSRTDYPILQDSLDFVKSEVLIDSLLGEMLLDENEILLHDQLAKDWIKKWFAGSPTVQVYLPNYITKLSDCEQYYDIFLFWLFLEFKNNPNQDVFETHTIGVEKTITYYLNNPSCNSDFLDKISKMSEEKRAKYLNRKA